MEDPNSHHIGEQHTAYRRGMVLGLTMAEVGILIIFILLLMIGLGESVRERQARAMERREAVLRQLRESLQLPPDASVDEIQRMTRALQEVTATPEGQTTLQEARAALEEMRHIRDQIKEEGGSEALAKEIEQQTYRSANQKGQLQRYESRLKAAGLGKGERPCWVKPDGTIEYLYDVVLGSDGIRMRECGYDHRRRERALLPMPLVGPNEVLTSAEFLRRTQPLYSHSLAENCRFFVVVYDATGATEKDLYKRRLWAVEGHFYKRLDNGPAPF